MLWARQCQECLNVQYDKKPEKDMTDAYRNRKCKRCDSPALDFGKEVKGELDSEMKGIFQ